MSTAIRLVLLLFFSLVALTCNAQSPAEDVIEHDDDVLDSFALGDTIVAYLQTDLPSAKDAVNSVKRIVPVKRAARSGRLNAHARALVEFSLGAPHRTELFELSAAKFAGSGFLWTAKWKLWPTTGGFSGIPYEYRTYLRPNGRQIAPHFFLTDFVPLNRSGDLVFSALSFDDADPGRDMEPIGNADARSLATGAVNAFVAKYQTEDRRFSLNFHNQALIDLPVSADENKNMVKRSLWAIDFVAKLTGDQDIPNNTLTVWVSADGIGSRLSLDEWRREMRRTKR